MKISEDLRTPLDIKRMFAKYAEKRDLTPEEVEESWEDFKKWYAGGLYALWMGKFRAFFKRREARKGEDVSSPQTPKTLHELLVAHPEGVPVDVLHRLLGKPSHEVREALQELEAQDKASEVGYDVWSAK